MKRLIFVFAALFILILFSGRNARQNTVRFDDKGTLAQVENSQNAEVLEDAKEPEESKENTSANEEVKGKLAVTSFNDDLLKTNLGYNVIQGTVPPGTHSIKINNYKLGKFIPNQTKWSYIASTRFGTLKEGLNNYVIKAFHQSGQQIDSVNFSVDYQKPIMPNILPGVGMNHWLILLASTMMSLVFIIFRKYRWL